MWKSKEDALSRRVGVMVDKINAKANELEPLIVGNQVHIQNQYGNHPTRWDKTGVVMQVGEHDKYMIKVHGSGRVNARNCRFLRKFLPFGEKMIEEPCLILPSEEQFDNTTKESPIMPPNKLAPVIPEAPPDTNNPPSMPVHDCTTYPTAYESPTLTEGNTKDIAIPEQAAEEPQTLKRSTRERQTRLLRKMGSRKLVSVLHPHIMDNW